MADFTKYKLSFYYSLKNFVVAMENFAKKFQLAGLISNHSLAQVLNHQKYILELPLFYGEVEMPLEMNSINANMRLISQPQEI